MHDQIGLHCVGFGGECDSSNWPSISFQSLIMVINRPDLVPCPTLGAPDQVLPHHRLTYKQQLIPPGGNPPTTPITLIIQHNKTPPTYKYAGGERIAKYKRYATKNKR